LRPDPVGASCQLRCVILPEHVPGAPTKLEPMRRSEAVLGLMANAFNFAAFGGEGVARLAEIVRGVSTYRLRMGALAPAVDLVMGVLDSL
ncbi:MAG: hypothetical protein ACRDZP_03625, partial [Acidimicrobiales bacterium]